MSVVTSSDLRTEDQAGATTSEGEGVATAADTSDTTYLASNYLGGAFLTAFQNCSLSKLLIDMTTDSGGRILAFIMITEDCKIFIHTVGDDESIFHGDISATCDSIDANTDLRFACSINE